MQINKENIKDGAVYFLTQKSMIFKSLIGEVKIKSNISLRTFFNTTDQFEIKKEP